MHALRTTGFDPHPIRNAEAGQAGLNFVVRAISRPLDMMAPSTPFNEHVIVGVITEQRCVTQSLQKPTE